MLGGWWHGLTKIDRVDHGTQIEKLSTKYGVIGISNKIWHTYASPIRKQLILYYQRYFYSYPYTYQNQIVLGGGGGGRVE